jgi:GNAT superfamily N-acetyltransferase
VVRDRRPEDLSVLLPLLQRTHEQEGYPVRAAAVRADWLASPDELDAAVAVTGERVVGHVALHPAPAHDDSAAVLQWERAVGRPSEELAVVSRLFTDRSVRGAGTALLAEAVLRATRLLRVAVLLVDPDSPARGFYLRRGWQPVGVATQQWGHRTVEAALLVPPDVRIVGEDGPRGRKRPRKRT